MKNTYLCSPRAFSSIKKAFALFLCLAAISLNAKAQYTLQDSDLTVVNGAITACSYDFTEKSIIIPQMVNGEPITEIASPSGWPNTGVFQNKGITNVQFPPSLTKIGRSAFSNNSIESLSFPEGLQLINNNAFRNNKITSVELPNSLLHIASGAFDMNRNLENITLPFHPECEKWYVDNGEYFDVSETVAYNSSYSYTAVIYYTLTDADVTVNNGVLETCNYDFVRKFINVPETLHSQTIIGIEAPLNEMGNERLPLLASRGIITINLPSTLKFIGAGALMENSIKSITIPKEVKTIKHSAFANNSLTEVIFEPNSKLTEIERSAFTSNDGLKIALPTPDNEAFVEWVDSNGEAINAQELQPGALAYISKIPYTLTDDDVVIEDGMIKSCSYDFSSRHITIPQQLQGQTVTAIGLIKENGIFSHKRIMEINLPSTIVFIGAGAFMQNWLKEIDLTHCSNLSIIDQYAFYSNDIKELIVPASVVAIKYNAFAYNRNLNKVTFEDNCSLVLLESRAFDFTGEDLELRFPTPVKAGYIFDKWESLSGALFNSGAIIPNLKNEYSAIFSAASSMNDVNSDFAFTVLPNPAKDLIYTTHSETITLEIVNISGNIVVPAQKLNSQTTINISHLKEGIYMVIATNAKGEVSITKLLKAN